jgi:type IV secretory pathway TrbD component
MPTDNAVDGETGAAASVRRRPGMLRLVLQPGIARAALKVSLVVGTLLNVINNGEQLWAGHGLSIWRVALNFVVPFCVSSYSAARNEAQRFERDTMP